MISGIAGNVKLLSDWRRTELPAVPVSLLLLVCSVTPPPAAGDQFEVSKGTTRNILRKEVLAGFMCIVSLQAFSKLNWVFMAAATVAFFLGSPFSATQAGELGANKSDLMLQYLPPSAAVPDDAEGYHYIRRAMAKKAIADARDAGLPFLRVSVSGYWPVNFGDTTNDLALWQSNPAVFWAAQDEMFDDLDRASIGLIPSFVWNLTQFPVLGGDKISKFIREPKSPSRQLLHRFVSEFIARYKDRKSVLFYELTNELNLEADLDLRRMCRSVAAACVFDGFTTADMIAFSQDLVATIKSIDPSRPVASGFAVPRRSATHLMHRPEFSAGGPDQTLDTREQFRSYLLAVHQPFDIVSVHIYPEAQNNRFGRPDGHQYELVADASAAAKAAGKRLFVGEFGDLGPTPFIIGLMDQLILNHVEYAAIWAWEFYQTSTYQTHNTSATKYSVEPGYSDDLIAMLRRTQRAMGGVLSPTKVSTSPRVVLTWPLPCATVDRPIDLAAVASDGASAVKRLEFVVDGKTIATSAAPPYFTHFDPKGLGQRTASIEVHAIAASGATAVAASTIRLNDSSAGCDIPRR